MVLGFPEAQVGAAIQFVHTDDCAQSTRAARGMVGRRYPLNFSMNLGRGTIRHEPSGLAHIDAHISEHAQLWTYRAWADWMAAEDWDALRRKHSIPTGTV